MKKSFIVLAICCLSVILLGACGSGSSNYQEACENLDFVKAHEILKKLRDEFVNIGLPKAYNQLVSEIKGYNEYVDADIYIFREEATYLMSLDDPAAENRIVKLIMETPLDGKALEEGSYLCSDTNEKSVSGGERVWLYCYCIKRYNQKCDIALDLAIMHGSQSLAQKVLMSYKDNMYIHFGDVKYASTDKDAAQKRYDEAVKNGVFQK